MRSHNASRVASHALALWVGCCAGVVAAGEGIEEPPGRWSGPCGTAAGTHASRALPILGDVEEAWKLALPGDAVGPPVHDDGIAYLLCAEGSKRTLLAIQMATGQVRAKKPLPPGPMSPPLVWEGMVIVKHAPNQLMGYVLSGSQLEQRWKPDTGGHPLGDPVASDSQVFVVRDLALLRLTLGKSKCQVLGQEEFTGRPAVRGDFVFVLGHMALPGYEPSLHLFVYDWRSGARVGSKHVAWYVEGGYPPSGTRGSITIGAAGIFVEAPAPLNAVNGRCSHALLPMRFSPTEGAIFAGEAGLHDLDAPPSTHKLGLLARSRGPNGTWHVWELDEKGAMSGRVIAEAEHRPDLFRHALPATVLGDVACFGTWAADVETGEVLWYLPVTAPRFAAVPADGLLLVVDGAALRAFREARAP